MPQVPVYNGPQVRTEALRPVFGNTPDVSSGARAIGQALGQVGEVIDQKIRRDAETEAWQAQAKIAEEFDKWDTAERQKSQGSNAKDYRAKVDAWWTETQKTYASTLSPLAQRAIGKSLAAVRNSTLKSASDYETQQVELGTRSAFMGSTRKLIAQAIRNGADAGPPVISEVGEAVRKFYKERGLDGDAEALKITTGAHVTIFNQLMQRNPKSAEQYFNTHKGQIDPLQHDEIGARINQVSAITDGETKATELWDKMVKPGDYKNPVDLFALEKAAREAFPNDPTRQKAAIGTLREMTAAWNKSQVEVSAANTNAVYDLVNKGTPMSSIMRSQAWLDLPEKEQRQIRLQLENEALVRENRATNAEARRERQLLLTNGDAYLIYSDPATLASMSRPQVQALRSVFGFDATKHLLDRYDTLQKPGKIAEARMDTEDFNFYADRLGLKPFNAKTPDQKRALGDLKYRVEQMIDIAQRQKGKELTREEKGKLMEIEMTRKVTVDSNLILTDPEVPVIQLTPEQVKKVKVPANERAQIVKALQTMYERDPTNPMFAPTEENVRREYLIQRSPAARLIPSAK